MSLINRMRLWVLLLCVCCPALSCALEPEIELTEEEWVEIEAIRAMQRSQMRSVVARSMALTSEEGRQFWPLYDAYVMDLNQVNDRFVLLVSQYSQGYAENSISDKEALKMMNEYVAIEKEKFKVRTKHIRRFKRSLPPKLVVRFFHIDTKLDAMNRIGLARKVPLFPQE